MEFESIGYKNKINEDLFIYKEEKDIGLYAIIDGHGGIKEENKYVNYIKENLFKISFPYFNKMEFKEIEEQHKYIEDALLKIFKELEENGKDIDHGVCMSLLIKYKYNNNKYVAVAQVGDCGIILFPLESKKILNYNDYLLIKPHRLSKFANVNGLENSSIETNEIERERVKKDGGIYGYCSPFDGSIRIGYCYEPSRTLGDNKDKIYIKGFTAVPEIIHKQIINENIICFYTDGIEDLRIYRNNGTFDDITYSLDVKKIIKFIKKINKKKSNKKLDLKFILDKIMNYTKYNQDDRTFAIMMV